MTAHLSRTRNQNPDLDLSIQRVIRAPKQTIWNAWTTPDQLAQWWIPAPLQLRVDSLELTPGGAFVTRMSEDGTEWHPHVDAVFLVIEEGSRLVFTNAVNSSWHPALPDPVAMTTEIILGDHPDGTDYHAVVRHGSPNSVPATKNSASSTAGEPSPTSWPPRWNDSCVPRGQPGRQDEGNHEQTERDQRPNQRGDPDEQRNDDARCGGTDGDGGPQPRAADSRCHVVGSCLGSNRGDVVRPGIGIQRTFPTHLTSHLDDRSADRGKPLFRRKRNSLSRHGHQAGQHHNGDQPGQTRGPPP